MLTTQDWHALDQAIISLHKSQTFQALEDHILHVLPEFLGATFSSWNEHDDTLYLQRIANSASHEMKVREIADDLNRSMPTHPLFPQLVDRETGKVMFCDQVLRTRENIDDEAFYQTQFYQKAASHLEVQDQLIMHVYIEQDFGIILTFHNDRIFTEKEILLASIIRGHIIGRLYTLKQELENERNRRLEIRKGLAKILSPRETQVLEALCLGQSNREIASELDLSARTVDSHVANLLDRLEASSRFHLIARYSHWLNGSQS